MSTWCAHDVDEEHLVNKYDQSSKDKGKYPADLIPNQEEGNEGKRMHSSGD